MLVYLVASTKEKREEMINELKGSGMWLADSLRHADIVMYSIFDITVEIYETLLVAWTSEMQVVTIEYWKGHIKGRGIV